MIKKISSSIYRLCNKKIIIYYYYFNYFIKFHTKLIDLLDYQNFKSYKNIQQCTKSFSEKK